MKEQLPFPPTLLLIKMKEMCGSKIEKSKGIKGNFDT